MLKRPVAVILLVTLMPQLTGCIVHTTQAVPLAKLRPEERSRLDRRASPELRTAGVTTFEGSLVMFDTLPAPREERDSVFANVEGRPAAIPTATIAEIWVARRGHQPVPVRTSDFARALKVADPKGPIAGVTTRTGERVAFDRTAPVYIAGDTLHAAVLGRPYALALGNVERIRVVRADPGLSALVWVGMVGCVAVVLVATHADLRVGGGGWYH